VPRYRCSEGQRPSRDRYAPPQAIAPQIGSDTRTDPRCRRPVAFLGALGARAELSAREEDGLAARVLDALAAAPGDPDALARRLGVPMPEMAAAIARLLIRGRIASALDGRVVRR